MRAASLARLTRLPARPSICRRPSDSIRLRAVSGSRSCGRSLSTQPRPGASIAKLLDWRPEAEVRNVVVNGYIRSVRSMKARSFVALSDGSSLAPLQAMVPADRADGLTVGAAVRLTGSWVSSPGASQSHELHVDQVNILGPSDAKTFPIQKKYQTPEYLRTMPHLRPRTPYNAALLRLRSSAMASLTQFFASRDFTQTHPPVITSSDCEGAGEVFTVAPANHSPDAEANESFFRSSKYLTVSTQLHLEALAQSVGNVWTLAPTFRAEKSDTSRHLAEFYMLEAEMTFVDDMGGVMDLAEDMLRHLSTSLFDTQVAQELFTRSPHLGSDLVPAEDVKQRWEGLMQPSWPRITYTEAINTLNKKADTFDFRPVWGNGLQAEHERYIAQHVGGGKPVFVTDYPRDIKAFYMKQQPDSGVVDQAPAGSAPGPTVECFDLLVPELCEIAGGSMREHRLPNLLEAMRRHGIATPPSLDTTGSNPSVSSITGTGETTTEPSSDSTLDWYVDLRRWGCPPHGGFGIGFDRLLCYLSGVRTIRDVVAFPRWFGRCDC